MPEPASPRVAGATPAPRLEEVTGWLGFEVDDLAGAAVGRLRAVYLDADRGAAGGESVPAWLLVALRRRGGLLRRGPGQIVAVPVRECAAAAGRVWVAHEAEALRSAPAVDPTRPLLREHELAICAHYGIGERLGRAAEVLGRPEGAVTSLPG